MRTNIRPRLLAVAPLLLVLAAGVHLLASATSDDAEAAPPAPQRLIVGSRDSAQPQDMVILPDSSKLYVACPGSNQLAAIDLKTDQVQAILDAGKLPLSRLGARALRERGHGVCQTSLARMPYHWNCS